MSQPLSVLEAPSPERQTLREAHGPAPGPLSPAIPHAAELFLDRDLSLLEFHRRVFDEARDETAPLLERVKFLGIVGTITDEFVVTRYAELARHTNRRVLTTSHSTSLPAAHLQRIETQISDLLAEARSYLREQLAPALAVEGIHLVDYAELQPRERAAVEASFRESVLPLLMPLGFDAARPFPHVASRDIAFAVIVRDHQGSEHFACVQAPATIPAWVPFRWRRTDPPGLRRASAALEQGFVRLDEVMTENLAAVFPGMEIVEVRPFRVFRDARLDIELSNGVSLPDAIERGVRQREFGRVVALMVGDRMPHSLVELLSEHLRIPPGAVHRSRDMTDLARLVELCGLERPNLHDPSLAPRRPDGLAAEQSGTDIFAAIRHGDILLHHPYESFEPAIEFIEKAADDPDVLAISTTLYRVGSHSPVVNALLKARRAGKQVRVVVELRARFDEQNNIAWGRVLEQAGAHVVYGMVDLKVHAKLTLVVRREGAKIRRYVHVSSGNYDAGTSKIYTDLGLLTCRDDIASDATDLFNFLTGYASPSSFRKLLVAPMALRNGLQALIQREMAWAQQGQDAHIILKMNALVDKEIVGSLYRASQAGVRVDLIVRGICCLRPGVVGVSDNIRVLSIVGRFLEHSRAWYFRNGGSEEIYLGSADLMPRNLDERVEVMVPVGDARLKRRIRQEILSAYLADNVKARELMPDGSYVRVRRLVNAAAINSQQCLL